MTKYLTIIILLLVLPFVLSAQTKSDYELVMSKFIQFYNNKQPDSINAMFSSKWKATNKPVWPLGDMKSANKNFDSILSYKLIMIDAHDGVTFKIVYPNFIHATRIKLNKSKKIYSFYDEITDTYINATLWTQ